MEVREKSVVADTSTADLLEYTHLPLGIDVPAYAGFYSPEKEVRVPFHGREILYVIGQVVIESACQEINCTTGSSYYVIVPGYILKWQYRRNEDGFPVSKIETITDFKTRKEVEQILQEREAATRVEFR